VLQEKKEKRKMKGVGENMLEVHNMCRYPNVREERKREPRNESSRGKRIYAVGGDVNGGNEMEIVGEYIMVAENNEKSD